METKTLIRKEALAKRDLLDARYRNDLDRRRTASFIHYLKDRNIRSVWFYSSYRSEADTLEATEYCLSNGIQVALPKVTGEDRMEFYLISSLTELQTGAFGISEPMDSCTKLNIRDHIPDIVVLPGAAFDFDGHRIGYGKGYYDRYFDASVFQNSGKRPLFMAFCYEIQIYPYVPFEDYDIRADILLTEKNLYTVQS